MRGVLVWFDVDPDPHGLQRVDEQDRGVSCLDSYDVSTNRYAVLVGGQTLPAHEQHCFGRPVALHEPADEVQATTGAVAVQAHVLAGGEARHGNVTAPRAHRDLVRVRLGDPLRNQEPRMRLMDSLMLHVPRPERVGPSLGADGLVVLHCMGALSTQGRLELAKLGQHDRVQDPGDRKPCHSVPGMGMEQ